MDGQNWLNKKTIIKWLTVSAAYLLLLLTVLFSSNNEKVCEASVLETFSYKICSDYVLITVSPLDKDYWEESELSSFKKVMSFLLKESFVCDEQPACLWKFSFMHFTFAKNETHIVNATFDDFPISVNDIMNFYSKLN